MPEKNNTFCIAPWVQIVLRTNKKIGPCCLLQSPHTINDMSISDYYNSDWNEQIKKDMLLGNTISGCEDCYHTEELGYPSMRQNLNRDYKIVKTDLADKILKYFKYDQLDYPSRLELHISNICNLKCLTCQPEDSSAFLTETSKIRNIPISNLDYQLTEDKISNLLTDITERNIDILDLRGGESMMIPKIKNILLEKNVNNIRELRIQTNGTVYDDTWGEIFSKFKNVEVHLSIDAFDEDNHYIRYPADWSLIESTVTKLKKIPNVNLCLNTVVSNLNLSVLPKLFDWAIENSISVHLTTLFYPEIYRYTNLPQQLLTESLNNISKYLEKFKEEHILDQITALVNHDTSDLTLWDNFCNEVSERDNYRNNSIFNILPKLKEYWTDAKKA